MECNLTKTMIHIENISKKYGVETTLMFEDKNNRNSITLLVTKNKIVAVKKVIELSDLLQADDDCFNDILNIAIKEAIDRLTEIYGTLLE